jgi:hypothetical protein
MSAMPTTNGAVVAAQRFLDAIKTEEQMAADISANREYTHQIPAFSRQNIVRNQMIAKSWKMIGRQVLAMHPEVVDEVKIASSDKIPGEILRVLPYMNPLVVFASPPEFNTWIRDDSYLDRKGRTNVTEDKMRLLGFMTYGTRIINNFVGKDTQDILATNDPDANRFGILVMFEALDATDRVLDVEFSNITIFFDKIQTLSEMVDSMMERFHWDETKDNKDKGKAKKWMRQVLSTVIGSLFYLCSTTLEAEKVPAKAAGNLHRGISRKPLSLYRIGWTTGSALTRFRQSRTNPTSEQMDQSHQRDPEHRRSHFKMQPYGPGRTLRKLTFISAYWTHKERLGEEGVNTVRKVPRTGATGEAREAQRDAMKVGM